MLQSIAPKLPMRNKDITLDYYVQKLRFKAVADYTDYLIVEKDDIEIHFFLFQKLIITENYGQVYIRLTDIEDFYEGLKIRNVAIHPNGALEEKPWGQKEFSLLDPDSNLLTFGEELD